MKEWRGLWLPDGETHMIDWMAQVGHVLDGKPTYQYHKLEQALQFVKRFRTAVDIGAHCGLWSMHLAKRFDAVQAFEPVEAHCLCFERNVPQGAGVILYRIALGEREGSIAMRTAPSNSGDSWVDGAGAIAMRRLDDLNLQDVDFMKLDCEGYELFALRGAERTLERCRPCVIVEQKPGKGGQFGLADTAAVEYLQSLGATLRGAMAGDYVLSWD